MIRSLKAVLNLYIPNSIYSGFFHSHIRYGIIFWGGYNESKMAFRVQKSAIQIISSANKCKSHRQLFMDSKTLAVTALYILEVLCYIKRWKEI
jgi:hypothetical protein